MDSTEVMKKIKLEVIFEKDKVCLKAINDDFSKERLVYSENYSQGITNAEEATRKVVNSFFSKKKEDLRRSVFECYKKMSPVKIVAPDEIYLYAIPFLKSAKVDIETAAKWVSGKDFSSNDTNFFTIKAIIERRELTPLASEKLVEKDDIIDFANNRFVAIIENKESVFIIGIDGLERIK